MRKMHFCLAMVLLFHSVGASAQTNSQPSAKKIVVTGRVSQDGRSLIGDLHTWLVDNPKALAGREGRIVKVKCRLYADTTKILVLSVKPGDAQTQYAINYGDAAFRR
jgi:hypothetical protein